MQFSFGVAAAAVADMDHIPEKMQLVFDQRFQEFDWMYLKDFLPPPCYAARSITTLGNATAHTLEPHTRQGNTKHVAAARRHVLSASLPKWRKVTLLLAGPVPQSPRL